MTSDPADQPIEIRRRRLGFRSWHRGTREADLIMGRFADRYLAEFDDAALDSYELLLEMSDPDLYNWLSGREAVPAEHDGPVMRLLVAFAGAGRVGRPD